MGKLVVEEKRICIWSPVLYTSLSQWRCEWCGRIVDDDVEGGDVCASKKSKRNKTK